MKVRSSIGEFLTIVTFIALALAALTSGRYLALAFLSVVTIMVTAFLIIAFVARDARKAFAIGFLIPFAAYVAVHGATTRGELEPYDELALPTTRGFSYFHSRVVRKTWHDHQTDEELPDFELQPGIDPLPGRDYAFVSASGVTGYFREVPSRTAFALTAHGLLAMVAGYLGAKFAVFVWNTDESRKVPSA